MRFKIDENLPVEVAELLRHAGHDALTMWDQHLWIVDERRVRIRS
jgi:predicted nuclease of predicted toxin-antitoxin system